MRIAAPDWEGHPAAYEMLIRSRDLPDSEDEHVNAAALSGHADCIVTSNLKPFPDTILGPLGLEATHPDDFIVNQLDGLFPRHLLPLPVGQKTKSPAFAGLFGESVLLIRAYWSSLEYLLAERVGFEPTVGSHLRLISSQVHSTTLPPLRVENGYFRKTAIVSELACPAKLGRTPPSGIEHLDPAHIGPQHFGNCDTAVDLLVILQNSDQRAANRQSGPIQRVQ